MWLTIEEVSDHLKVSKETIYKLAKGGKIPCSKIGNQWRFNQQLVDEWLVKQTVSASSPEILTTGPDSVEVK